MKKLPYLLNFSFVLIIGLVLFTSCDDEDDPTFTLVSLTANGIDLAGVTAAADVPEDAVITAVFSSTIDPATVSLANINIVETEDNTPVDYTLSVDAATVMVTPTDGWPGGSQISIELTSALKGTNGANFAGNTLTFRTSGIFVPQKDYQVLFLSFDNSTLEDEAGSHTVNQVMTLGFDTDRRGTPNSAAAFTGQGNLVEVAASEDLISPSITISFWFKTMLTDYDGGEGTGQPQTRFVIGLGAEKGYMLEMGRRSNNPTSDGFNEIFLKYATNHVNIGNNSIAVPEATAWSEVNSQLNVNYEAGTQSGWSFAIDQLQADPPNRDYVRQQVMGDWVHLVMTFDATMQQKTFYVNGMKWASFQWIASGADWLFSDLSLKTENNDGTPMAGLNGALALGFAGSSTNTATPWADYQTTLTNPAESKKFFKGSLDQFRIYSIALNESEVMQLYENEQ